MREVIVKVGGSLYDLPDLGRRLRQWLDGRGERILLVPGGGPAADWIRQLDAADPLGAERAHWLALRSLTLAAHVLAARLPNSDVIDAVAQRHVAWQRGQTPILDLFPIAAADEVHPEHLDHTWDVTSDSLAARACLVAGIKQLVLLKSCDIPESADWRAAAREGLVDAAFPCVVAGQPLTVAAINFRAWRPGASSAVVPPGRAP
jgi:aspartokinase-like uncharacterized kinase